MTRDQLIQKRKQKKLRKRIIMGGGIAAAAIAAFVVIRGISSVKPGSVGGKAEVPEQIQEVKFFVIPVEKMLTGRSVTPNDPAFKYPEKSWHFGPIQAFEAWGITQGSDDIVVGITSRVSKISNLSWYLASGVVICL